MLRERPCIWLTALAVTLLLLAASVGGVLTAAAAERRHRVQTAEGGCRPVCVRTCGLTGVRFAARWRPAAAACWPLPPRSGDTGRKKSADTRPLLPRNTRVQTHSTNTQHAYKHTAQTQRTRTNTQRKHTPRNAGFAENTAAGIESALLQLLIPAVALSTIVKEDPSVASVLAKFPAAAAELLQSVERTQQLQQVGVLLLVGGTRIKGRTLCARKVPRSGTGAAAERRAHAAAAAGDSLS